MGLTDPLTVQAHVSSTFVPLSAVTRLSGGTANFTFRATLLSPLPTADAGTTRAVVIKHAEPFMATNQDIALDPIRCHYEYLALSARPPTVVTSAGGGEGTVTVRAPTALHYCGDSHILVQSDAGEGSRNLKAVLLSLPSPGAPLLDAAALGRALGTFLRSMHVWGSAGGGNRALEQLFGGNAQAGRIWTWATYGRLAETADRFPALLAAYRPLFEEVAAAATAATEAGEAAGGTLIHGDFWSGNIVLSRGHDVATVVDWEMARRGPVWCDLAQMCAELYLPYHFYGVAAAVDLLDAFLHAYGPLDADTARCLVVHFGVHLVVWPCRVVPSWGSGDPAVLDDCIRVGAEFVEHGWRRDWHWVRQQGVLRAVVNDEWI